MKRERWIIDFGGVQKNPAVLVGRPGLNKKEGSYGKFKAE
jgi:hypothetical protein